MKQLQSLNGIRFIFFMCVFFSHYVIMGSGRVLPNAGEFAVVFFFMLSGFSLSYGYGERIDTIPYGDFIKKRLLRLWPMQILTLLLRSVPLLLIPLIVGNLDIKNVISFILKLFFLEGWVPNEDIIFNYNSCAWYLSPLVFCYFLFPFLYKWVIKIKPTQLALAIFAYLAIYVACIFIIPQERHQVFLYAAPYFRFFDFALGIMLFRVYKNKNFHSSLKVKNTIFSECLILVFIALIAWLPLKGVPQVFKMASVYWIPAILIILSYLLVESTGTISIIKLKWIQRFGDASYEMYMTHLFIVTFFNHIGVRFITPNNIMLQVTWMMACLVLSIIVGMAVRKYVNIPLSGLIKKEFYDLSYILGNKR